MNAPFIVMTGLPASGKSTLGRALHLPMLDKDEILEALFDSRGIGNADWRHQLSRAADQELMERAVRLPAAVIASWWRHPRSTAISGTPTAWLHSLQGEVFEIHCVCTPSVAASRFISRTRHAGHVDGRHTFETLLGSFQCQAPLGPLGIGRTIEVGTETEPSIARLMDQLGCNPNHAQPTS